MSPDLSGLLDAVIDDPALARAVRTAADPAAGAGAAEPLDLSAPPGLRPFVVAALAARAQVPVLAVTATSREADELTAALATLLPGGTEVVAHYPAWETLPHERLSPRADTVGRRIDVLRRLAYPETGGRERLQVVVAPVRSILQPQVPGLGDLEPVTARVGDELPDGLDGLVERLAEIAYARVDLVEKRGEFAVRGGIVDVFPPTEDHPVRVELFGDEVESVRRFAVADQRSLDAADPAATPDHGLLAPPCRELLLTPEVRGRAARLAAEQPASQQGLREMLDKIADGTPVEGMEALTPVLADALELLVEILPARTHIVVCDPEKVRLRAHELVRTSEEFLAASWATAAGGGHAPVDLGAAAYRSMVDVRAAAVAAEHRWWTVSPFTTDADASEADTVVVAARAADRYRGESDRIAGDLGRWLDDDYAVVLTTAGHGSAERLVETLREADLPARLADGVRDRPEQRLVTVACGSLDTGFVADRLRLAVLTEVDLVGVKGAGSGGSTRDMRALPSRRRRNAVDPLSLSPGDFVVHDKHGVGRFVEMISRTVQGATREYLILEYAASKRGQPADRLFVPTDQLEQLSRYSGGEAPSLHRIGGADWAKAKGRARKAVKEIAAELIRLYAARTSAPGHAFGPDTPWQRELEDAFPYVETPDQRSAIDEVKADMEKSVPMDRVICGDVGYGKTEIAVRAVFKAVMDGKQAAVLVPTTLLVQQHFQTFSERYAQFPVRVMQLSRFQTEREQKLVLAAMAKGEVDVVIGTHRLLAPASVFKDLGLVVVDEEQRFGVEHKEYLKRMRINVDVLTMSATPIPRTLEMSITGIRELSTIDTPPEERHPVLTFVGAYDDATVAAAIRRELLREGQVFYIHNRVESIDRTAGRLRDLVPEARIAVAHGQMGEDQLEPVMVAFWERDFDVLVCTTIVESGLDVSNANTMIVERADVLGLSQLHQLRGRVGRGRDRAYGYFLFPPEKPLTETAHDRLTTLAQNSELGSGMAVALKDLEIRGAGNLLGGEQSGHIAAVGFDLYIRMVGEAVADFKGETPEEVSEVKVELPVDAHLPHDYVTSERLRLEAYRRLASAESDSQIDGVRAELVDRYGPVPEPVENLLAVAAFRIVARRYGVQEISGLGPQVRFAPLPLLESQTLRLQRLYKGALVKQTAEVVLVPRPLTGGIGSPAVRDRELLGWCRDLLRAVVGEPPPPSVGGQVAVGQVVVAEVATAVAAGLAGSRS